MGRKHLPLEVSNHPRLATRICTIDGILRPLGTAQRDSSNDPIPHLATANRYNCLPFDVSANGWLVADCVLPPDLASGSSWSYTEPEWGDGFADCFIPDFIQFTVVAVAYATAPIHHRSEDFCS